MSPLSIQLPVERMDLIQGYRDEGDDNQKKNEEESLPQPVLKKMHVNAAPTVQVKRQSNSSAMVSKTEKQLKYNPTAVEMYKPTLGPESPYVSNPLADGESNVTTGFVERVKADAFQFKEQYQTFNNFGYASAPDGSGTTVGNKWLYEKHGGKTIFDTRQSAYAKELKRKREATGDASDVYGWKGPWAGYGGESEDTITNEEKGEMTEWQRVALQRAKDKKIREWIRTGVMSADAKDEEAPVDPFEPEGMGIPIDKTTTKFHGKEEKDYLGRSWIVHPSDVQPVDNPKCYLPNKCIHKWTGHTDAVPCIEFFPTYGHLLLSASMDTKVKIWDVYNKRNVKRTYMGHTGGVRWVAFSPDGTTFLSASFDLNVKLWDTESGKCLGNYSKGTIPFQAVWAPTDPNVFLSPCQDSCIHQFDVRTGECTMSYNYHEAAVNAVCFYEKGRKFVSTSDDRKMLCWDFGYNPPTRYIQETYMTSMPALKLHPSGDYILCQSLNNQISVYKCMDTVVHHPRKRFNGHKVGGFALQPVVSPDGEFVGSGDCEGNLWFWNWKTCKVLKKMPAHSGANSGLAWHPVESSYVASSGWDGVIKLWSCPVCSITPSHTRMQQTPQ